MTTGLVSRLDLLHSARRSVQPPLSKRRRPGIIDPAEFPPHHSIEPITFQSAFYKMKF